MKGKYYHFWLQITPEISMVSSLGPYCHRHLHIPSVLHLRCLDLRRKQRKLLLTTLPLPPSVSSPEHLLPRSPNRNCRYQQIPRPRKKKEKKTHLKFVLCLGCRCFPISYATFDCWKINLLLLYINSSLSRYLHSTGTLKKKNSALPMDRDRKEKVTMLDHDHQHRGFQCSTTV